MCHTWVSERSRSNRPVLSLVRTPRITYDAEMPRGTLIGLSVAVLSEVNLPRQTRACHFFKRSHHVLLWFPKEECERIHVLVSRRRNVEWRSHLFMESGPEIWNKYPAAVSVSKFCRFERLRGVQDSIRGKPGRVVTGNKMVAFCL